MALWSNTDANTSVPKFAPSLVNLTNTQANSNLVYANTTAGAFITGATIGVFGVDAAEESATSTANTAGSHAGWVLRKVGTGGRAGRVHRETLVALTAYPNNDASDDTQFPE